MEPPTVTVCIQQAARFPFSFGRSAVVAGSRILPAEAGESLYGTVALADDAGAQKSDGILHGGGG